MKRKRVLKKGKKCDCCQMLSQNLDECYNHPEPVCQNCLTDCDLCLITYCKDCVVKCGNIEDGCENYECKEHRDKRDFCSWCTWVESTSKMDYHIWLRETILRRDAKECK